MIQFASDASAKAKELEEELQYIGIVRDQYTYGDTVLTKEEIDIFVAREKAEKLYHRKPNFAEVAELTGKYTTEEVRQIFCSYFTKMYQNGHTFLLTPYLKRLDQAREKWIIPNTVMETIRNNWKQMIHNYIKLEQNLYNGLPEKYEELILTNETKLLESGKIPSVNYLAKLLHKDIDTVRTMIYELIGHMSFNSLKDVRNVTERWNLTDIEKRKLEFDIGLNDHDETINIDNAYSKMQMISDSIKELCTLDKIDYSYHIDQTLVFLSTDGFQRLYIKSVYEYLRVTASVGGENIGFELERGKNKRYCLNIYGVKEGNAIITIENSVNASLMHIFVIVLPMKL